MTTKVYPKEKAKEKGLVGALLAHNFLDNFLAVGNSICGSARYGEMRRIHMFLLGISGASLFVRTLFKICSFQVYFQDLNGCDLVCFLSWTC